VFFVLWMCGCTSYIYSGTPAVALPPAIPPNGRPCPAKCYLSNHLSLLLAWHLHDVCRLSFPIPRVRIEWGILDRFPVCQHMPSYHHTLQEKHLNVCFQACHTFLTSLLSITFNKQLCFKRPIIKTLSLFVKK